MRKIITLDERFADGAPTVTPVLLWSASGKPLYDRVKHASEASEYIKHVEPKPGMSIILVLALGAYEYYDLNRNGDGFNERPYKVGMKTLCGHPECQSDDGWIAESDTIPHHYKSFEEHGKIYKHHQNKDPLKSFGDIFKAFHNPQMHRIELLLGLRNDLAPDLIQRIADGEYLPVSMGCAPAGSMVWMADATQRGVEAVKKGDWVISHRGLPRRVTGVMVRKHTGTLYNVKTYGVRKPLPLTGEHPLWTIPAGSKTFEWRRTDQMKVGDQLAMPVPTYVPQRTFTADEARFLGFYLAEGYVSENSNLKTPSRGVVFCTGLHEKDTHNELYDLIARLGYTHYEWDAPERNGKYIGVTSPELADLCSENCGSLAKEKRLSASVLGADPETLKILLGAYANGDGFSYAGALYFSTASELLADQLLIALARCGAIASVQRLVHKPSKLVPKVTVEYQIRCGRTYVAPFMSVTCLTRLALEPAVRPDVKRSFMSVDGTTYILSKITRITETPYDGDVFNFEVEEDESYVMHNLAVHNCRIKYDVCTECGHRAPKRSDYCDHLKFNMRQVGKRGLRYGALNPSPKWFDISVVARPADQTGYMMKKVAEHPYEIRTSAEAGEYLDYVDQKKAALQKISDIDKIVRGIPVDHKVSPLSEEEGRAVKRYQQMIQPAVSKMPVMDPTTLNQLSQFPIAQTLSTLSAAGVILTTPEFIKILLAKMMPGTQVPESALDAIVGLQGKVFDLFAQHPQLLEQLSRTGTLDISAKNVRPEIGGVAAKYLEKRSTIGEYLNRAMVHPLLRKEEPPNTDTFTIRDPATGSQYQTNRGAALAASDEIDKRELAKILGGSALLGGAYKVIASGLNGPMSIARAPLAASAAMLGYQHLRPDYGPQYMTDEGVAIPASTELHEVKSADQLSSVALPMVGSAGLVAALSHDYESRLRRGENVNDPNAPLQTRLTDQLGSYAYDHPATTFMGGLGSVAAARALLDKFSSFMGDLAMPDSSPDSVTLPSIDVDRAAEKIGGIVLP